MNEQTIIAAIIVAWGALNLFWPEPLISLRKKLMKVLYGADFKPTTKTTKVYRILGIVFIVIGALFLAN